LRGDTGFTAEGVEGLRDRVRRSIEILLKADREYIAALEAIAAYEARYGKPWTWVEVGVPYPIVIKLVEYDLVDIVEKRGTTTTKFRVVNLGLVAEELKRKGFYKPYQILVQKRRAEQVGVGPALPYSVTFDNPFDLPDDTEQLVREMFPGVVGYDDIKRLIVMVLRSRWPQHVLLIGPLGIGKTFILENIKAYMEQRQACVVFAQGGKGLLTAAGLRNVLMEEVPDETPCVLLIDELDKVDKNDQAILLNVMETGELVVTMGTQRVRAKKYVWAVAATNDPSRLIDPLMSRFFKIMMKPLTRDEWLRKVPAIIRIRFPMVPEDLARYIAEKLVDITKDPRDAIRIASMARTREDVDFLVQMMLSQGTLPTPVQRRLFPTLG